MDGLTKEQQLLADIQDLQSRPGWKLFTEFLDHEIEATSTLILEGKGDNEVKYNQYDIWRSELQYLKGFKSRLDTLKDELNPVINSDPQI